MLGGWRPRFQGSVLISTSRGSAVRCPPRSGVGCRQSHHLDVAECREYGVARTARELRRRVSPCIGQDCDLYCVHMSDTLPFSEVKAHLSELADRVERQHDRILVTRNGRPSFVLVSPDDLESLEESLDILKDDKLMDSLRRSRRDAEQGDRVRLKDHV